MRPVTGRRRRRRRAQAYTVEIQGLRVNPPVTESELRAVVLDKFQARARAHQHTDAPNIAPSNARARVVDGRRPRRASPPVAPVRPHSFPPPAAAVGRPRPQSAPSRTAAARRRRLRRARREAGGAPGGGGAERVAAARRDGPRRPRRPAAHPPRPARPVILYLYYIILYYIY